MSASSIPLLRTLRCDCCGNAILSDYSDYIQNNPCKHSVCFLCFVKSNLKRGANPECYCCQVKDCPQQYTIVSCQYFNRGGIPGEIIENETIVELGTDEIACILSFLPLEIIMRSRRVCKKWGEAAAITTIPPADFRVEGVEKYNAMRVMTRALPNLQQITLRYLGRGHKYSDGEDPDERVAANTADLTSCDIEIISNFRKLRSLEITQYAALTGGVNIQTYAGLNGRYLAFFNLPNLQKLTIETCKYLKWDLGMLAGLPALKELRCVLNCCLTGNISSLRVLKDTLKKVSISHSDNVEGNFMDLADFPHLKALNLNKTAVTGDIRDISKNDFSSLKELLLPTTVYGVREEGGYLFCNGIQNWTYLHGGNEIGFI